MTVDASRYVTEEMVAKALDKALLSATPSSVITMRAALEVVTADVAVAVRRECVEQHWKDLLYAINDARTEAARDFAAAQAVRGNSSPAAFNRDSGWMDGLAQAEDIIRDVVIRWKEASP